MGALSGGRPAACGALGNFDSRVLDRIAGRLPDVAETHRDRSSALWIDREPLRWEGAGERGLAWPERVPARIATAGDWRQAAAAGGCGLVLRDDEWRGVHASGSGVAPLYWAGDGRAIYFATTIDALAFGPERPLRPDWRSWASILALGYCPGSGTPFESIQRLGALGYLEGDATSARLAAEGALSWTDAAVGDPAEAAERVASALRAELAGLDPDVPIVCPLSGGFDSRLLACLLAERDLDDLTAWTVNTDQGNDVEENYAAAVAAELGIPHRVVTPNEMPFPDEFAHAAISTEHESLLHLEMARLGRGLPEGGVVVDGLAGDVLFKDLFVDRRVVEASDWRTGVERFFDRLLTLGPGSELYGEAWQALYETARDDFLAEGERFADHSSAPSLAGYWARTRRGVSTSPVRLLAQNRILAMPFLADEVALAALSASLEDKLDGRLYRRLLEVVNPVVARLPSTNDALPAPKATRPRINRSREARQAYLDLLERSPLRPWFSERLEAAVGERKLGPLVRSPWLLTRIHHMCNFTLWSERYRRRLSSVNPTHPFPIPAS